jgi:sialic acid synthase SpsE
MEIRLTDKRLIGDGHPVLVIAEVGNNHQGRFELAERAVAAAAAAGADAVSFQYAPLGSYVVRAFHDDPRVAYLKECEFSLERIAALRAQATALGLAFSVNVEDAETLDAVLGIGIDYIKLCSADLTNVPLLRYCATKGRPIFFSTGGAYLDEIRTAYDAMRGAGMSSYVVYHTNSGYPTPVEEANLLQMDMLQARFGGLKGYCDHTAEIIPSVAAAARGARVIEKHITTSRALKGDDWMVSLEPEEFALMVKQIRQAEAALGSAEKKPLPHEESTRSFKRKSICSRRAIRKGEVIDESMLTYKVPAAGISPTEFDRVVGRRAALAIEEDIVLRPEMIEGWE